MSVLYLLHVAKLNRLRPAPTDKTEAHILFPLFMVDIGSVSKVNRLTVEYRPMVMETTLGFGNIFGAHMLLDTVWQKMNEGQWIVDWEALMKDEAIL